MAILLGGVMGALAAGAVYSTLTGRAGLAAVCAGLLVYGVCVAVLTWIEHAEARR
jgi:hypothetical protein